MWYGAGLLYGGIVEEDHQGLARIETKRNNEGGGVRSIIRKYTATWNKSSQPTVDEQ
jgi:hypothetical protein